MYLAAPKVWKHGTCMYLENLLPITMPPAGRSELSEAECGRILALRDANFTYREIGAKLSISPATAYKVVRRYNNVREKCVLKFGQISLNLLFSLFTNPPLLLVPVILDYHGGGVTIYSNFMGQIGSNLHKFTQLIVLNSPEFT
jgi:hypothetical protein